MRSFCCATFDWAGDLLEKDFHNHETLESGREFVVAMNTLTESLIQTPREFSHWFGAGDRFKMRLEWSAPARTAGAARITVGTEVACMAFCLTGLDPKLDAATVLAAKRISAQTGRTTGTLSSNDIDTVMDRPLLAIVVFKQFERMTEVTIATVVRSLAAAYFNLNLWKDRDRIERSDL